MNFASDNTTGAHPAILDALARGNDGAAMPYGNDPTTARVVERLRTLFEKPDLEAYLVATGSAANALALAALVPSYGAVICHRNSHLEEDECGAPEFFTGGAKLKLLDGDHGKIAPDAIAEAAKWGNGEVHHAPVRAVSLTNLTERGTAYGIEEVSAIAEVCRAEGLKLHMDGARFANAVVGLDVSPAQLSWKAGVDVLSFGATKNGALAAEAVILFDPLLAKDFGYRRKRAGHLVSKMRLLSLQMDAYLADDLWRQNASHANTMATHLAVGLSKLPSAELLHEVQGNEIFVRLPEPALASLRDAGFTFYDWSVDVRGTTIRLVTAFNTQEKDVQRFLEVADT